MRYQVEPIAVAPEVVLSPKHLLQAVREYSGLSVSRATLYRWRIALNMPDPPYDQGHVIALSKYGGLLRLGLQPDKAVEKTCDFLKQLGL